MSSQVGRSGVVCAQSHETSDTQRISDHWPVARDDRASDREAKMVEPEEIAIIETMGAVDAARRRGVCMSVIAVF